MGQVRQQSRLDCIKLYKKGVIDMKQKREFSKTLLIQESVLIWINTLAFIALAFYCVINQFFGELPWITAMTSCPWAAYGVSQAFYYRKSTAQNTKDGITYELAMKDHDCNNICG